jgi:hypothetical protein
MIFQSIIIYIFFLIYLQYFQQSIFLSSYLHFLILEIWKFSSNFYFFVLSLQLGNWGVLCFNFPVWESGIFVFNFTIGELGGFVFQLSSLGIGHFCVLILRLKNWECLCFNFPVWLLGIFVFQLSSFVFLTLQLGNCGIFVFWLYSSGTFRGYLLAYHLLGVNRGLNVLIGILFRKIKYVFLGKL